MLIHTFALILTMTAAEKPDPEPKPVAPPKADIRGKIESLAGLKAKGLVGSIRVEGDKEKDTDYDKAAVRLTTATKFYEWKDGKKKAAKFADLKVGTRVQCVFTGPVAESYPVQATASEVLILPAKK